MRSRVMAFVTAAALAAASASCGDGSSTTPSPPPTSTTTITLTAAGASPQAIVLQQGGQVTFVNNDSRVHDMVSDPHPEHTDCPEINFVGSLRPGQTRQTGNLTQLRTCGFHDHGEAENRNLRGTITTR